MAFATTAPSTISSHVSDELLSEAPKISHPVLARTPGPGVDTARTEVIEGDAVDRDPVVVTEIAKLLPFPRLLDQPYEQEDAVLRPLQSWEGVVLDVGEETFSVRVADVSGEHADEEMELDKAEISEFDLELLQPGAIFYWTIGYREDLRTGGRERVSKIRLRRLPAWSRSELVAARERAATLAHELEW